MFVVGEIKKNSREIIRFSVGSFKDHPVADLRVCYEAEPGLYKPGPKGLTFSIHLLPDIVALLKTPEEKLAGQIK